MLRVGDLQRSIDFYSKAFGMNEIRRRDVPDGKYTLAFVGYGDEEANTVIELTYNYGVEKYEMGGAFGAPGDRRAGRGDSVRGGEDSRRHDHRRQAR